MERPRHTKSAHATLRLLAPPLRRQLLAHLADADGTDTTRDELAAALAASGPSSDEAASRDRIAVELHHSHLPVLREAGLVDYDPRHGAVRYCPREDVEDLL